MFGELKLSQEKAHTGAGDKSDLELDLKGEVIREDGWRQRPWKELEKGRAWVNVASRRGTAECAYMQRLDCF